MKPPKVKAWIAFIWKHLTSFFHWISPYLRLIASFFKALWQQRKMTWKTARWYKRLGIVTVALAFWKIAQPIEHQRPSTKCRIRNLQFGRQNHWQIL
jgi:hypothetical protein